MDRVATLASGFGTEAAAFGGPAVRLTILGQGLLLISPCVPRTR